MKSDLWNDDKFFFPHFTTTSGLGNMRDAEIRKQFLSSQVVDHKNLITAQQVHGNKIAIVDKNNCGQEIAGVDGLITSDKTATLAIFTADCLPVFIGNTNGNVIGLIHAGWRGLASGILIEAVKLFNDVFQINSRELVVLIGPHIRKCCYHVGSEVLLSFPSVKILDDNLDLSLIATAQLKENGVEKIYSSLECTHHNIKKYFSYRREKTNNRMMSFICL